MVDSLPHQLTRTRRFSLGAPSRCTVAPDGRTVLFLRSRGGAAPGACLWATDAVTGEERMLADPRELLAGGAERLSPEERTRRERARQHSAGIVGYAADDACELVVFALSSRLWALRPSSGEVRPLATAEPVLDPRPDPTGRWIAYVSDGALRVVAADGGADRVILAPDGPDVAFGLAEHVAAESMGRHRGYWWAPDGRALLVARVDNAPVQRWYVSDPADPGRPPTVIAYPAVGTANADVSLWLAPVDPADGDAVPVDWDTAAFEYLAAAGWDEAGPYAAVQDRSQRRVVVLGIDAGTGATKTLAEQRDDAWVTLVPGLPTRTAEGVLVTSADLDDTRRLVVDGEPVTPPGLQLDAVLAVDGETVLFAASEEPTELQLWTYAPRTGPRRITGEPGLHEGTLRAGTLAVTSVTPDRSATTVVRRPGARAVPVRSDAERPVLEPHGELLRLGPRELRAALFLPSWHRPGDDPLPVLLDPYGGP
ncbi:MAG TPA: DPP IV N-terminal domain-containing protein, partial [Streptosporangiales bacterium]